jgi:hypothetical protein
LLGDKISYSRAKIVQSGIWRASTWKAVLQAMVGTGSVMHKKDAGVPSVDEDTVEIVGPLPPFPYRFNVTGYFLLGLCKGPDIPFRILCG